MPTKLTRDPGRPPDDWARRARVWVWLAEVLHRESRPDDQLDRDFLPLTKDRRRTFNRIRRLGDDAEARSKKLYHYSLVDRVDAEPEYRGSARGYRTPLWDLLIPPGLTLEQTEGALLELAHRIGLMRLSRGQAAYAQEFLQDMPAYESFLSRQFKITIARLQHEATADNVAMLALMYREAVQKFALSTATALAKALVAAAERWLKKIQLPREQFDLVMHLIERRIVRNDWGTLPKQTRKRAADTRGSINTLERSPRQRQRLSTGEKLYIEFLETGINQTYAPTDKPDFYWVPTTSALGFFLSNEAAFKQEAMRRQLKRSIQHHDKVKNVRTSRTLKARLKKSQKPDGMGSLLAELRKRAGRD